MYAFWEIIASNAIVATILAIGATLLSRIWKNAAAVHVLWVVVLLKLFTPPLVTAELPVAFTSLPSAGRADSNESRFHSPAHEKAEQTVPVAMTNSLGAIAAGNDRRTSWNTSHGNSRPQALVTLHHRRRYLDLRRCCTAVCYAVRIRRFASVIRDSEAAPPAIRTMVAQLSSRLGLRRVPDVLMTSRALPPLVWSIGLFPRVILPSELFARLSSEAQGHNPRPRTRPYPARRLSRPAP